ncbi:redoxin family protein [Tenacibaculum piscium]|uniref:TlpA family protein disulfide reductase n=1 Tax=Tenacibaculum piscium TaxID=1458515 RepID=UPI00187B9ADB|nr:TlpA disulfide reductase family protein [Tenacibaculum piscium]MBE7686260.1 redoxin family protein [Tenacibaculum piscium]MBE7689446.1 redoxin family protein [Tenacibaculum piscium]
MIKYILLIFTGFFLGNCSLKNPTEFSKEALNDTFISFGIKNQNQNQNKTEREIEREEVLFKDILSQNKGKKIVIDVWASWCKDCLESLPDVKKLQAENPTVVFVYLSLDKDLESWETAVHRLNLKGQHYFMQSGWEGKFAKFLGVNWIPRYLLIAENGAITVFNETKITDDFIGKILKK